MSSHGRLANKVCIVTGGGSGFGQGISTKFVAEGAKVVIADLSEEAGSKVAKELGCESIQTNVAKREDWEKLLKFCVDKLGGVDVVINNAGATYSNKPTLEVTDSDFDLCFNVNTKPLHYSAQTIVPHMQKQGRGGAFVVISSTAAIRPRPGLTWYSASKAAASMGSKIMAVEYASDHIRFNSVNPVVGGTGMTHLFLGKDDTPENRAAWVKGIPLGRFSKPEDVANACCYLASDEANFITGVELVVDGGRCV